MKVSTIKVQSALKVLFSEVQTVEGVEAYELLCKYVAQQKEKAIKKESLIVENSANKN